MVIKKKFSLKELKKDYKKLNNQHLSFGLHKKWKIALGLTAGVIGGGVLYALLQRKKKLEEQERNAKTEQERQRIREEKEQLERQIEQAKEEALKKEKEQQIREGKAAEKFQAAFKGLKARQEYQRIKQKKINNEIEKKNIEIAKQIGENLRIEQQLLKEKEEKEKIELTKKEKEAHDKLELRLKEKEKENLINQQRLLNEKLTEKEKEARDKLKIRLKEQKIHLVKEKFKAILEGRKTRKEYEELKEEALKKENDYKKNAIANLENINTDLYTINEIDKHKLYVCESIEHNEKLYYSLECDKFKKLIEEDKMKMKKNAIEKDLENIKNEKGINEYETTKKICDLYENEDPDIKKLCFEKLYSKQTKKEQKQNEKKNIIDNMIKNNFIYKDFLNIFKDNCNREIVTYQRNYPICWFNSSISGIINGMYLSNLLQTKLINYIQTNNVHILDFNNCYKFENNKKVLYDLLYTLFCVSNSILDIEKLRKALNESSLIPFIRLFGGTPFKTFENTCKNLDISIQYTTYNNYNNINESTDLVVIKDSIIGFNINNGPLEEKIKNKNYYLDHSIIYQSKSLEFLHYFTGIRCNNNYRELYAFDDIGRFIYNYNFDWKNLPEMKKSWGNENFNFKYTYIVYSKPFTLDKSTKFYIKLLAFKYGIYFVRLITNFYKNNKLTHTIIDKYKIIIYPITTSFRIYCNEIINNKELNNEIIFINFYNNKIDEILKK